MIKKVLTLFVLIAGIANHLVGQNDIGNNESLDSERWVDSVYNSLSDKQKVAQMFMVAAYSNLNEAHYQ